MTDEGFRAAVRLRTVSVFEDGSAEFYFADGDLFWGHTILVGMNKEGGFEGATIAG